MENITFNLTELHKHGSAFFEFLALRKQFFVDDSAELGKIGPFIAGKATVGGPQSGIVFGHAPLMFEHRAAS